MEKTEAEVAVVHEPRDSLKLPSREYQTRPSPSCLPRSFTTVLSLFLDSVPQNETYYWSYRFGIGRHGKRRYLHRMSKAGWEWMFQPEVYAVVFVR